MSSISDLRAEFGVSLEFPDVKKEQMDHFLLKGFQELCRNTGAFYEDIQDLTVAGTDEYTLTPATASSTIFSVLRAEFSTIDTPTAEADVTDSGGSLAIGTYSYKVSATYGDYGETVLSDAISAEVTVDNSQVTLTWDAVDSAEGYKVYGRTDGAELLMETTTGTSYTDDGTDTPAGAQPSKSNLMREIKVTNAASESLSQSGWKALEGDDITGVIYSGESTIRLSKVPLSSNMGFRATVALFPTTASVAIPTRIEPYKETIKDYARFRLYSLPANVAKWNEMEADDRKIRRASVSAKELSAVFFEMYQKKEKKLKRLILQEFGGPIRVPQLRFGG